VLLSTHDPLLALSGARRLVIRHGAVAQVIEPSAQEQANRTHLAELDRKLAGLRERLRRANVWTNHGLRCGNNRQSCGGKR